MSEAKKKNPFAILGVVVGVVISLIGLWMWWTRGEESTDDAQVSAEIVPIQTRVQGMITVVGIEENKPVKAGELLVQIDDADYQAKVKKAQAELQTAEAQAQAADAQVSVVEASSKGGLASARAAYSGSSVGVASADAQIASAKASMIRAEADAKKTELDLSRAKDLRKVDAMSQQGYDNAEIANQTAQAALTQAKALLAAAEEQKRAAQSRVSEAQGRLEQSTPISAQIATARANAALAHARVDSAKASLDLANLDLSYTKIVAPADGVCSSLTARKGMLVMTGQMLMRLVPNKTYVLANFKETQIGKMKKDDRAEIEIDAFPHQKFEGKVESLSGGTGASFALIPPDNASGNFVKVVQRVPVRISWVNMPPEVKMRAGLSADVTVRVR